MISKVFIKNIIIVSLLSICSSAFAQIDYEEYFTKNSMRVDYYHSGTHDSEYVMLKEIRKEEFWGGTKTNLIDPYNYGTYRVNIYDAKSNERIFSYGFCSLFEEWQFTDEAKELEKGFPESLIFPYPLAEVKVELLSRNYEDNTFKKIFELNIDPNDNMINEEKTVTAEVKEIYNSNTSDKALDLVFIGDGYTKDEIDSFYKDVEATASYLFSKPPFAENQYNINIWAVAAISTESGTDIPQDDIWVSTALNSNFNTFGSDRYLTSSDFHAIRNYAGLAPCDQVCVLVNSDKYGGGGIYNFWNITAAKNSYNDEVFIHELGHSLGSLADEYYTSEVSTEDLHNKKTEPYQANITTLVDFESKWKDMLDEGTPIPTEPTDENADVLGVYEGGGYQAKGIYRPYINCTMKALSYDFCPVCQRTLTDIIEYYSK